ncbi:TonB-dependent receptor [candidate division KSB1 bacterium]|nr:TonB-dependent receptor [candidate division KSB1 bacterium]
MKKNNSHIFISTLLFCMLPVLAFAQTTGKIKGRIVDAKTGEALPGANVVIEGTTRGAAADLNGEFIILSLSPGKYNLNVQMIGYAPSRMEDVKVSVNRTAGVEIRLQEEALAGEEVVVTASRVVIKKDQTSSIRNVSSDEIELLPVNDIGGVIRMQAGVVNGHFRGGRLNEVSYMVDGIQVDETFDGNYRTVDLEAEAIQDLEVITGSFNAEYGRAMSGVVNAVTKSGSANFHGSLSGELGEYFTGNDNIWIGLGDRQFDRNQDYKASLSGPVLGDRITFFSNFRYQKNNNHLYGLRRFNVDDFSDFRSDDPLFWISEATGDSAYVPMDRSKNLSFLGKLSARLNDNFRLSFLYTYNNDEWHYYDHGFKYNPDGLPGSFRESDMYSVQFNHIIASNLFYELKLSYLDNYNGWYIYENPFDSRYVHDMFLDNTGPGFYTGGQQKAHNSRTLKDTNVKFDLTWQANKEHSLKGGFLYTGHNLDNAEVQIRNRYYGTELEFQLYEPMVLPDSTIYSDIYQVKPYEYSAYLQDKMEFNEMVINLGLRYDYFNPNSVIPSQRRNPANQLRYSNPDSMSTDVAVAAQTQISPRLGLSYQLSNAALLRFSYGHFFQMPPMNALYQNHSFRVAPTDYETTMGNAALKAQKTVQYEFGVWQELMPQMGLEVALFYRDIYDLLSAQVISTYNQIQYGLYSNKDYGNVKGLEVKWDYRLGNFSSYLNYTLQFTRGNADNPTQTFNRAGDSKDPIPRLIPMSWDQRHTLNTTAGYNAGKYGVTSTFYYDSGSPYTFSPVSEELLSRVNLYENNAWRPSKFSVDLTGYYNVRLTKDVNLKFTLLVFNLFDRLNENSVDSQTGRAYTAIITDADRAAHRSNFNTYEDRVENPSMYSAPRMVKLGMGVTF